MQRLPSRGKSSKSPTIRRRLNAVDDNIIDTERASPLSLIEVAASVEATSAAYNAEDDPNVPTPTTNRTDADVFERPESDAARNDVDEDAPGAFASGYEELPIEIQSLMERFLESLVTRSTSSTLSVDRLAELYQDFYEHSNAQINTHIAALSTKISRETSPTPSVSSGRSSISRGGARRRPPSRKATLERQPTDHQLLTASEVTDRRKARRQLELKRVAMEEAVERGVCEKVYPRLWRHQSTNDEARDEKLRSRAAALSVVGVNLKELLSTALSNDSALNTALEKSTGIYDVSARELLAQARSSLEAMNAERFPAGKLTHLTAAHKAIVEALQQMLPSASSADEVLPTLIYTIITSEPESNSVVSNFNFIERFRASSKVDGEAAYCLTNLEAAISFLENVDLTSIRSSEAPEGPPRPSSQLASPGAEVSDPLYRGLSSNSLIITSSPSPSPLPARTARPRAFSGGLHSLEAASDAVRSGANDIHHALDGGFKFLFGRLKEKRAALSPTGSPVTATPRTLEDARKLISQEEESQEDAESINEELPNMKYDGQPKGLEAQKLQGFAMAEEALRLINGITRERSVDSSQSADVPPTTKTIPAEKPPLAKQTNLPGQPGYNPVDSFRNIGNALNPFKGFAGMGMSRSFGRTASSGSTPSAQRPDSSSSLAPPKSPLPPSSPLVPNTTGMEAVAEQSRLTQDPAFDWNGIAPPMQRFVKCPDARELNFFDVELLLRDYQRLAGAVDAATVTRSMTPPP